MTLPKIKGVKRLTGFDVKNPMAMFQRDRPMEQVSASLEYWWDRLFVGWTCFCKEFVRPRVGRRDKDKLIVGHMNVHFPGDPFPHMLIIGVDKKEGMIVTGGACYASYPMANRLLKSICGEHWKRCRMRGSEGRIRHWLYKPAPKAIDWKAGLKEIAAGQAEEWGRVDTREILGEVEGGEA